MLYNTHDSRHAGLTSFIDVLSETGMLALGDGGGRGCRHRLTSDAFAEPAGAAVLSASRGARQLMEDADAHAGRYEQ